MARKLVNRKVKINEFAVRINISDLVSLLENSLLRIVCHPLGFGESIGKPQPLLQ